MPTCLRALSILLCTAAIFASGPAPGATPATELVAGRRIESVAVNNPAAPVCIVFENGSRATLDGWSKVLDALPPDVSLFAYNRPGYGNSDATGTERDGATIVAELRQLLQHKGLRPPYVLVGHSLGGLYMQLFARAHPDEVAGLVLVDALYPRTVRKPEDFPLLTRAAKRLFFSGTVNREIDRIHQTGEEMMALPPFDDRVKPVVQLINQPKGATAIGVDFGVTIGTPETSAFVRSLYPKGRKIILDSDHRMQEQSPVEVSAAIREVIAAVGTGRAADRPLPD